MRPINKISHSKTKKRTKSFISFFVLIGGTLEEGVSFNFSINHPKPKWYNLLSHIIKVTSAKPSLMVNKEGGKTIQHLDLIHKITCK